MSDWLAILKGLVDTLEPIIGTGTDAGHAATLFGRQKKVIEAVHVHVLLVVGDTAAMDADLDTALQDFLEGKGYDVVVADPTDVAGNLELYFDAIVVSASCDATDVANLANLKTVDCPVICHSALIAVSAVFNLGGTAGTEAAQTQIEIMDNTVQWFLEQALADLAVTASATIYTMATKTANAITLAEEDTGTGTDLTMVQLPAGQDDGGTPAYAPDFGRYFLGVANFTEINAAFTAILEEFYDQIIHQVRFSPEVVVTPKRVYQEGIPDTDVSDTATTTESDCILLDRGPRQNRRFSLRDFRLRAQADPAANTMTVRLYEYFDGALTEVDSFDIVTGNWELYYSLETLFGLQEVHSDAIRISCQMDVGTLAVKATYSFAEAKK